MKNYTVKNRHGFVRINGHFVRMTQSQADRFANNQLEDFPYAKSKSYCLTDAEMVNGATNWPELTASMEAVFC